MPFQESLPRQAIALAAWVLVWAAAERLLLHLGLGGRAQLAAFLAALLVLTGTAALAARGWLFRLFTSVRFAVAQGIFLSAAAFLVLGADGRGPAPVRDGFHSLWFCALLALLAASTLAVTCKRRPYDLARLGFLLVHLAPSLILLGLLWGRFSGVRTVVRLHAGTTVDRLDRTPGAEPVPLPGFRLRLENCEIRQGDSEARIFSRLQPAGSEPGPARYSAPYPATAGTSAVLPQGYRMDLLQVIPNAVETGQVLENPLAPAAPALRVVLGLGLPEPLVGHLYAQGGDRSRQDEPGGRFAVVFREAWDDTLPAALRPAPARTEKLVLASQGRTAEHSGKAGDVWELPGFTLRVAQVFPDFAVHPGPNGEPEAGSQSDTPREPWVQLDLLRPDGQAHRLLLSARNPALTDRLNAPNLPPGTTLHYLRDGEEVQRRFVLFTRRDQRVRLLVDGRVVRTEPLVFRRPFIVEKGFSVTPDVILEHAEPVYQAAPPAPGAGADRRLLQVKLTDPGSGAEEEQWLEAKPLDGPAKPARFFGGKVTLVYRQALPEPAAYRSELVLLDPQGQELARKTISLGDPLWFRGYGFYQAAGDPDDAWVSGIQVVREPGLGLVGAGFACLILGCFWMFYLKPGFKRRAAAREVRP